MNNLSSGKRERMFSVQEPVYLIPSSHAVWYLAMPIPAGGRERALLDFYFSPLSFIPCWLSSNQTCFSGSSHALLKLAERGRAWMSSCNKGKAVPSNKLALITWWWIECWKLERVYRRAMKTGKGLENTLYNGKCFCQSGSCRCLSLLTGTAEV